MRPPEDEDIGHERSTVLNTIAKMLTERGHEVTFNKHMILTVDGVVTDISIYQLSRFDPVLVQLHNARPVKTFRKRKDGTYNYEGIVESVEHCVKRDKAAREARKQREANRERTWVAERAFLEKFKPGLAPFYIHGSDSGHVTIRAADNNYRIFRVYPVEYRHKSLDSVEPVKLIAEYRRSRPVPNVAEFEDMARRNGLRLRVEWSRADVMVLAYTSPNREGKGRAGSQLWTLAGKWT